MVWLYRLIVSAAVIVVVATAGYFTYVALQPEDTYMGEEYAVTEQDKESGVYYAIVIDTDNNKEISIQTVMDGEDAMLMVRSNARFLPVPVSNSKPQFYIFNGASTLLEYDNNFDGQIRADDPIYDDLLVVSKRQTSEGYISNALDVSGIDNIVFNQDYLELVKQGKTAPAYSDIGYVTDDTKINRIIRVVPMPVRLLQ